MAALLIDQDSKTGHFRVDGTIGNDFVIKPMPQSAIDALQSYQKHAKPQAKPDQSEPSRVANSNSKNQDQGSRADREKSHSDLAQLQSAPSLAADRMKPKDNEDSRIKLISEQLQLQLQQPQRQQLKLTPTSTSSNNNKATLNSSYKSHSSSTSNVSFVDPNSSSPSSPSSTSLRNLHHLHDDDPHDDDEMFLDEDEALELYQHSSKPSVLSHLSASPSSPAKSSGESAATTTATATTTHTATINHLPQSSQTNPSFDKSASERKWRKYKKMLAQTKVPKPSDLTQQQPNTPDQTSKHQQARPKRHAHEPEDDDKDVRMTHHIIYRLRPSAEGSSSEHQGSFLMDPRSMDGLVGRLQSGVSSADLESDATEWSHDPYGGQFYLEPGANTNDQGRWSLWSESLANATHSSDGEGEEKHGDDPSNKRTVNQTLVSKPRTTNRYRRHISNSSRRYQRHAKPTDMQSRGSQVRRKRQAPDTVWPEVLLVVDYDSFLLHGGDSRDVKRYFVSFWNGVDLRYKLLVHPHIRISLAGMIVAKDRDATPYLERNRLRAPNADAVDAAGALTDMGKYLYREDRLPTYDLAVVITKLDMCRRRYEGGRCNRGTAGFAYVGGACVVNKRLEKVNSVAIIEDSGGFSGIIVAAHEVGHL